MSHHGRDDEREDECGLHCTRLNSAVQLISQLARDEWVHTAIAGHCDAWLERNGFECEASRRRRRERRASELDAEIERLRAERAKL